MGMRSMMRLFNKPSGRAEAAEAELRTPRPVADEDQALESGLRRGQRRHMGRERPHRDRAGLNRGKGNDCSKYYS